MGRKSLSGLAVVAVATGAGLVAGAGPAFAASSPLYVNNTASADCSDSGTGTQSQPYCTIGAAVAAVTPGQTIQVTGTYNEHVTIAKSGMPGQPITIKGLAQLSGAQAGITIDGQHDIAISAITVLNVLDGSGIVLNNATRLSLSGIIVNMPAAATAPGIRLAGVTDSTFTAVRSYGAGITSALVLDAATSGIRFERSTFSTGSAAGSVTVDLSGSKITFVNSTIVGGAVAALAVRPGATGTVIANSTVQSSRGVGILDSGGIGTAVTNNRLLNNCGSGVRLSGPGSGASVQNNVFTTNVQYVSGCDQSVNASEIAVADGAVGKTVVDYNNLFHWVSPGNPDLYSWNGTPMGLTAFRAASGQGVHDLEQENADTEDSANSAAPGYQDTDVAGRPREDNPMLADKGAGPITYADRGPTERILTPTAGLAVTADHNGLAVTADASSTVAGYEPIVSYLFDFGDGVTLTQATPVATHHYAQGGTYFIAVMATDAKAYTGSIGREVSLWKTTRTVALLAHDNNRYVSGGVTGGEPLTAGPTAIGAGEVFEVADLGNGWVALRSRVNGLYLTTSASGQLTANSVTTNVYGDTALFELTNNSDGTITLRSVATGGYVSSNNGTKPLTADRSAIGVWERFGVVEPANASVSLRAHANGKYVTAEQGGAQPLIANRAAIGLWETYDLVDAGGGYVALYSHANGKYVTAENGGSSPLIARATAIGLWEKFKVVKNADGSISLLANANGRYVTAEYGGAQPLIANRTAIGPWEEFDRTTG